MVKYIRYVYDEVNMKKYFCILIIFVAAAALILISCVQTNYADVSDNIKYVSADFYITEGANDSKDRLIKDAELIYTKMNITPKGNMAVKGISFDAKLKEDISADFVLNIYITNSNKSLEPSLQNATFMLYPEYKTTLTGEKQSVVINFTEPYNFDFTGLENDNSNSYTLCVEFLDQEKTKNNSVNFTLNNIKLLT